MSPVCWFCSWRFYSDRPYTVARAGEGADAKRGDRAVPARGMSESPFAGSRSESREHERANRLGRFEADGGWTSGVIVFRASRTHLVTSIVGQLADRP